MSKIFIFFAIFLSGAANAQYDFHATSPPAPPPPLPSPTPEVHPSFAGPQQFILIPISAFAGTPFAQQFKFYEQHQHDFNLQEPSHTVTSAPIAISKATLAPHTTTHAPITTSTTHSPIAIAPRPIPTQPPYGSVGKNLRAPESAYGTPIIRDRDSWDALEASLDARRRRGSAKI